MLVVNSTACVGKTAPGQSKRKVETQRRKDMLVEEYEKAGGEHPAEHVARYFYSGLHLFVILEPQSFKTSGPSHVFLCDAFPCFARREVCRQRAGGQGLRVSRRALNALNYSSILRWTHYSRRLRHYRGHFSSFD